MKRKTILGILLGEGIVTYLLLGKNLAIPCLFKKTFHIPCPGCGLTRAFKAIFHLQFIRAMEYHIFSLLFILLILLINFCLLYDFFKRTEKTKSIIKRIFQYPILWIILILISELFNLLNIKR